MPPLSGWTGRVLHIDLTDRSTRTINPPEKIYREYLGGRGIAGYYLKPCCTEPWNSPDMNLIFFTGPLAGTASPSSGLLSVMSISPLTGTVCHSSAGGNFGSMVKRAGWDGIVITGKSGSLCGISISNGIVEFSDASDLKGKNRSAVSASLPPYGSAAVTGPAAENGVLFAGISFDGSSFAGRGGLGLVMAEKGLKYIHVSGTGEIPLFDADELASASEDINRLVSASPFLKGELGISEYGTGALYDLIHSRRMMPSDNFRKTRFDDAGKMNAHAFRLKYGSEKSGCPGCSIQCRKIGSSGVVIPEYETMSHFSALIGNSDIDKVIEASMICAETGMDPISAASAIACYMEINSLTCEDFDFIKLLHDTAASRGDGEVLKSGSFRYASMAGRPELSMSVKKLDIAAYDPRGAYGLALAYAVSAKGGCHMDAYPISHEILRKPVATERFSFSGKARIIKLAEDLNAAVDSLVSCRFIFCAASVEEYSRVFHAVTGIPLSGHDLVTAGERICYNERIMNSLNGFSADDDDLPERFFITGGTSGDGISIPPVSRDEFLEARRKYYKIRGLSADGKPLKEKSDELGLQWTD